MKALLVALLLFAGALSADMKIEIDPNGEPVLDQFSEEGFIDCVFAIRNMSETPKKYRFQLKATYKGNVVGFDVEVPKGLQSSLDADANLISENVYRRGIAFRRSGDESDRLVSALAELYELSSAQAHMVKEIRFTGIVLHQGPLDMKTEPVKIKLFGYDREEDDQDLYSESFFNLDLANGFVFWNEKDQEYRGGLVRSLGSEQRN